MIKIGNVRKAFTLISSVAIAAIAAIVIPAAAQVSQQIGPALRDMNTPQIPGDDRLDIKTGAGCHIKISKTSGCDVVRCKGEQPVRIMSETGITTAKTVAENKAKASLVKFFENPFSTSQETNEAIQELTKEGLNSEASNTIMLTITQNFKSTGSMVLRGVVHEEDGIEQGAVGPKAYVIVKTSCRTQAAASQLKSGMNNGGQTTSGGGRQSSQGQSTNQGPTPNSSQLPNTVNPYQRRSGGLD
jgi:hypothetical protein